MSDHLDGVKRTNPDHERITGTTKRKTKETDFLQEGGRTYKIMVSTI